MKARYLIILTLLVFSPNPLHALQEEDPKELLIRAEWIFRGDGDGLEEGLHILLRGDRIEKIGPDLKAPPGAEVIDAPGMCAMPGLIDAHVRLFDGFLVGPVYLYPAWGVTTVRDLENHSLRVKGLKEIIDSGEILGPRIVYSGESLTWKEQSAPFQIVLGDEEEAESAVRKLAGEGAGFLVLSSGITKEAAEAVLEAASALDLPAAADLLSSEDLDALEAVRLGVKSIEGLGGVPQALAEEAGFQESPLFSWLCMDKEKEAVLINEIVQREVYLVPTLNAFEKMYLPADLVLAKDETTRGLSDTTWEYWKELILERDKSPWWTASRLLHYQYSRKFIRNAASAGARIVAGSRAPIPGVAPGAGLHRELELLVDAGLEPSAALRAAMIEAARCIGAEEDLGSIEKGKYADLLIVEGNPLDDIVATKNICWVIKGGGVIPRGEIPGFDR